MLKHIDVICGIDFWSFLVKVGERAFDRQLQGNSKYNKAHY